MSSPRPPVPGILTFAVFTAEEVLLDEVQRLIEKKYGASYGGALDYDFSQTEYYREEMGESIHKRFFGMEKVLDRDRLYKTKWFAWKLEKKYMRNGKRRVNIDPGFLTLENFILLTFKNFIHRTYLRKNVYMDLTLVHDSTAASYKSLEWTYPDYRQPAVIEHLMKLRAHLLKNRFP